MELAQDKDRQRCEGLVVGPGCQVGGDGHLADIELEAASHATEGHDDGADVEVLELKAGGGDGPGLQGFGMWVRRDGGLEDGRTGRSSHSRSSQKDSWGYVVRQSQSAREHPALAAADAAAHLGLRWPLKRERQIIELYHVLHRHLVALFGRTVLQYLVQDLLGMREDRVAVWIVAAPQEGIRANEVACPDADRIVLERDVEVTLPVRARPQRVAKGLGASAADVVPVEPLQHDGRPARLELGDDELKAGVAFAHA